MMGLIIAGAIVLLGAVVAIGVVWLERGHAKHPAAAGPASVPVPRVQLDEATFTQLRQELELSYRRQIQDTTATFSGDLMATSKKLSEQVERLTTEVISTELEQYQKTLEQVRGVATQAAEQLKVAVAQQQTDLQKALEEGVAAERERRIAQIDARLSQIISGYLVESLGAGVDLGAQADYIIRSLEEHKEDIKQDLASGV